MPKTFRCRDCLEPVYPTILQWIHSRQVACKYAERDAPYVTTASRGSLFPILQNREYCSGEIYSLTIYEESTP